MIERLYHRPCRDVRGSDAQFLREPKPLVMVAKDGAKGAPRWRALRLNGHVHSMSATIWARVRSDVRNSADNAANRRSSPVVWPGVVHVAVVVLHRDHHDDEVVRVPPGNESAMPSVPRAARSGPGLAADHAAEDAGPLDHPLPGEEVATARMT